MAAYAFTTDVDLMYAAVNDRGLRPAQVAAASCALRLWLGPARSHLVFQVGSFEVKTPGNQHRAKGHSTQTGTQHGLIFVEKSSGQKTEAEQNQKTSGDDGETAQFASHRGPFVENKSLAPMSRADFHSEDIGSRC